MTTNAGTLTDLTIADAATAIRRDGVSPVELAQAHLDRIAALDHDLGAFVDVTAARALADARRAADELAAGHDRGRLHGIPVALKDLIDTAGIATAGGARVYAGRVPSADARVVERLDAAGCVLLGKLATHELAFGITTTNPHFGTTRNPHDHERIPGGSSGGAGAAVAARLAPYAIGTDSGGSVRIPAGFCGCVGLKPSLGRVSAAGVMPLSRMLDSVGPLTRTVHDAAAVLEAIAGYDSQDAMSASLPVPPYCDALDGGVRGLRIGIPRTAVWALATAEVAGAARAALDLLADLGAELIEVDLPDAINEMGEPGGPGLLQVLIEEVRTYHRVAWTADPDAFGDDVRELLSAPPLDGAAVQTSLAMWRAFSERYRAALDTVELLVSPTTPMTAPPVGVDSVTLAGTELPLFVAAIAGTVGANYAGLPSISLPCGSDASGLPIGLSITGRPFDEETVLRAAAAYERARP